MKKLIYSIITFTLLCSSGFAQAPTELKPEPKYPPVLPAATPLGTGPFKAIMEVDPALAKHTVYRPNDMKAMGSAKLPIMAWGNGACSADGNSFRLFLTEIASHGYLILANGPIGPDRAQFPPAMAPKPGAAPVGAAAPAKPPVPSGVKFAPATTTAQLIEAIDWAIAENNRPGSRYYGKLDTRQIAVAGMSCGGVQAIEASVDPRIKTTIVANSGLMTEPTTMSGSGKPVPKESLNLMHAPVLYMSGDESDIAYANANDDVEKINHIPVFRAYQKGVGHGGTYHDADGGTFGKVALAWLDWQLKGD
ncbi:MAG: alpha/beta hydrolase, partial [Acidobacteria bacterium]|nr:alpha/beta hydrolase [Acidobacteriota bacterium]